jgi:hypothetical protein
MSKSNTLMVKPATTCEKHIDCPRGKSCDPATKTCAKRSTVEGRRAVAKAFREVAPKRKRQPKKAKADKPVEKEADKPVEKEADKPVEKEADNPVEKEADKPVENARERDWDTKWLQGSKGFNSYAAGQMRKAGLVFNSSDLKCPMLPPKKCPGDSEKKTSGGSCSPDDAKKFRPAPYQQTVQYLVHPETSVDRLLIAHRTGLGKTFSMILILDNFYEDPRPKVVIFPPGGKVLTNFYKEVMKFPSRWRDFVIRETGVQCFTGKKGEVKKVIDALALTGKLSRAGTPGYPAGPLRAYTYSTAGSKKITANNDPLFKHGKPRGFSGNPYDSVVVLMDEFHNLIEPDDDIKKRPISLNNLKKAGKLMQSAKDSVQVGLTATPVISGPEDVRRILDQLRGVKYRDAPTDEGFVSYFQELPESVFASVRPGPPPGIFPNIVDVELKRDNLKAYNCIEAKLKGKAPKEMGLDCKGITLPSVSKSFSGEELHSRTHYLCTMSRGYRSPLANKSYAWPTMIKDDPEGAATKLYQVVKDIMSKQVKTLVMVHREAGFKALEYMWELVAKEEKRYPCPKACWMKLYDDGQDAGEKKLDMFNCTANKDGKLVRVMFVDSKLYEAGVSFLGVRRLVMVDVPKTWASWMQRMGRVLRFCGHENLSPAERNVSIDMYVSKRPSGEETSDQFYVKSLKSSNKEMVNALHHLRDKAAADRAILKVFDLSSTVAPMEID